MPVMHCNQTETRVVVVQPRLAGVLPLGLLLLFVSFAMTLRAQTMEIKVVNGRNGQPIRDKCMNVWVGDRSSPRSGPLLETQTDTNGVIRLRLDDSELNVPSQRLACGLSGVINPTLKYGDTVSVRTGYALCQPHTSDYSWLAMTDSSTEEVLKHGIVTPNTCGKATTSPKPGELVIFVRPLTWWEKLKQ
jgi:hypothetical protein